MIGVQQLRLDGIANHHCQQWFRQDGFNLAFIFISYFIFSIWFWLRAGLATNSLTFGNAKG